MEDELRTFVNMNYGPNAWNEVIRLQAGIRVKKKEAVEDAKKKQARLVAQGQREDEIQANRAQAIQDEEDRREQERAEMDKQRADRSDKLSREQMFRGINKGGLLNKKPKPKKKKTMKRGGIASKK